MNTTLKVIGCLLILFMLGVSCSDETEKCSNHKNQIVQPLNPNGDSELTLLMRAMFDEIQQTKKQIAEGDSITLTLNHEKILTAHATQPEKVASKEYKAFADTYLQSLKSIETVGPPQRKDAFNSLVNNCMNCHQSVCPGPMVKIKKLYL